MHPAHVSAFKYSSIAVHLRFESRLGVKKDLS